MIYNIDFDIAAAVILTLYYIILKVEYSNKMKNSDEFRKLILILLIADILDIITAVTISNTALIPLPLNYCLNIIYYISSATCGFFFPIYVGYVISNSGTKRLMDKINDGLFIVLVVFYITTPFTKFIFYFDSNKIYEYGKLHWLSGLFPTYFMIYGIIKVMAYRNRIRQKQYMAICSFGIIATSGMVIQAILPRQYLILFFVLTNASLTLLYALETPEYENLLSTMEDLKTARNDALLATNAKNEFLANMSHEIRTPINGILGMNEIALRETDDPALIEYLSNIRDAGNNLLSIINNILDFSKIESGKMSLENSEFSLKSLLFGVHSLLNIKARDKDLELIIDNDPNVPDFLYGDEVRLRQIMVNLISNGIKYTKQGHVKMYVTSERINNDKIRLTINVSDTGIGIKDEDQLKLFNSFQRVDLVSNRTIDGTGLGLRITKELAELMEGNIFLDSEYGKGSTFTINVSIYCHNDTPMGSFLEYMSSREIHIREREVTPVKNTSPDQMKQGQKTILAVDDIELNLMVVKGLLKKSGINVDTANGGQECIDKAHARKYDLIFLDHMMPEVDGIQAFHAIRDDVNCINHDTPIIAMTANAVAGARDMYISEGFDNYISKPVDPRILNEMLKKYEV